MSEVEKSDWDVPSNPVLVYANSYRDSARRGQKLADIWSVITDLERNIAPLWTAQRLRADTAEAELDALREAMAEQDKKDEARLADRAELIDGFNARLGKNSAKLKALVDRNTRLKYRINSAEQKLFAAEQRIAELEKDTPVEPFKLDGWGIDHSAGRPVLVHNKCSVIEAEQAYGLLDLIEAARNPNPEAESHE